MRSGQLNILNKLGCIISTKYPTANNPFEDEVNYAKRVLDGLEKDETVFALLYEPDDTKNWTTNDLILKQSNPVALENPEIWEDLLKKRKRAIAVESARENFLTKHCNIIYQGMGTEAFVDINDVMDCKVPYIDWHDRDVYIGVDLAMTNDNCAVAMVSEDSGEILVDAISFIPEARILKILDSISITPEDARKNYMKRQVFYSYPILRLGKEYLCTNISLLLFLFENSNYWVMRNKYFQKKSQTFISEFGRYFEIYVEEILEKCLLKNEFSAIEETSKGKRADWHISIGGFDFLVEQKSSISMLKIKQNNPDLKEMGKYITKTWGEAVRQLSETEKALNIDNAIKIILLYEDYYAGQCLDELFRLDKTLENDGRYWLINIREFEMLLDTYKNNPMEFDKVIKEKLMDDSSLSSSGHDVESILNNHNIFINNYLINNGIEEYARKEFKNYGDIFGGDESQTEG